ncbi:MAG TPA: response regulator [Chryseosolibacter sp.]|nr:response regulator [Chryseosolibacter sp.]
MNILLVEDDLVNQKIASQVLGKWGVEVTVAKDGLEALNVVQQKSFQLILMDINMPTMDGCEATSKIRSLPDPYFQNVPILAYTASTTADTKEKAEVLGMNDFVSKPLNPSDLHFKINQYTIPEMIDCRPLRLKLNLYSDSDADFRSELVGMMIRNLRELQQASYRSYYSEDRRTLHNVSHKVKSTLILLDDLEYTYIIDDLKQAFIHGEKDEDLQHKIIRFNHLTEGIIKTLNREILKLKEVC